MAWNSNLSKDSQLSQMTLGSSVQTGNPMIDMALNMLLGNTLAPVPGKGQSILDSYQMRNRSRDYMSLMRKGFGTSMMAQHLGGPAGINTDGLVGGVVSQMMGMTGVMDNNLMQAMNGGNPVKALMGLKANMTGMTMGQAFGHVSNADNETVTGAFTSMRDQFFKTRTVSSQDLREQQVDRSNKLLSDLGADDRNRLSKFIKKDGDKEAFDFDAFDKEHTAKSNNFLDRTEKLKGEYEDYAKELKDLQAAREQYISEHKDHDPEQVGKNFDTYARSNATELQNKLKKNSEDFDKLQKEKEAYEKNLDKALDTTKSVMSFRTQKGEKIAISTDAQAMRGFRIQDLTKSMTMMMDLNMVGLDSKIKNDASISTKDKASILAANTAKNSVGVLSAMRDLTGTEDASELTQELNSLMGNAKVNLSTQEGAAEVETLLRRVKATGRTAGIGLDALMEVVNQVKEISAAHPELKYAGGDAHLETSIRALNTTSALTATMGGDWVRMEGGQGEVSRMLTQNAAEAKIQPISKEIKGIVGLMAGDDSLDAKMANGKTKRDYLMEELNKWTNNEDSILAKGNHGFMDKDKATMVKKLAAQMGVDPMRVHNALHSESSSAAGEIYAGEHKQYNFDAAGEHGAAYDLVNASIRQELLNQGLSREEALAGEAEFAREMADRKNSGKTIETILAKTRKSSSGQKYTFSSGDNSMTEKNARNDQLMMAYTLHQNMNDPAFKKEFNNQIATQKTYAEEESRMDRELANLHQPFLDTVVQAYMGGSFGKGKDELLKMISTPDGQKRAGEMMDALSSSMSTTTAGAYRNTMFETLGGGEQLSEEAVRKNLELAGITDPAQLAGIFSKRRSWKENNAGFADFTGATKTNTLGSIHEAYKELMKNGAIDEEKLSKLGISKDMLRSAGKFMENAGIDYDKFGSSTGESFMKNSPMSAILSQSAHIGYEATKKAVLELKEKELSGFYQKQEEDGGSAAEKSHGQLGLLAEAGYLKRLDGHTGNAWSDFDWDKKTLGGLDTFIRDKEKLSSIAGGKLSGLLTSGGAADIKAAFDKELNSSDKQFLSEYGAVKLDSSGAATWNDNKLKELQSKGKGLKAASENQLFDAAATRLDEAKKSLDGGLEKANDKITGEQLKEMTNSLTNGAGLITKQLSELASLMQKALQ